MPNEVAISGISAEDRGGGETLLLPPVYEAAYQGLFSRNFFVFFFLPFTATWTLGAAC